MGDGARSFRAEGEFVVADITVRKENGNRPAPIASWEPRRDAFRMMRDLISRDPFSEMISIQSAASRRIRSSFEVKETKDAYVFKADVPGVKESDIEVTVTGNRLTVAGKREAEKQEQTIPTTRTSAPTAISHEPSPCLRESTWTLSTPI